MTARVVVALLAIAWLDVEAQRARRVERNELLQAMDRLHAFYAAPEGLQRPGGLAIVGRPDFTGIAAWIFDVYLACRSGGVSVEESWATVTASITQTAEWQAKHPGLAPRQPRRCTAALAFDRAEFLNALDRLHAFYQSGEGLQRPDGLTLNGAPDFAGIAAWIFDVYLRARQGGEGPEPAWTRVVAAIEATDEWKQKHANTVRLVRFAIVGDYGREGPEASAVAEMVRAWKVDFVITTGDNNYPNGSADTIDRNIGQYFADFIFPYRGSFSSTATTNRFFPTLGNHDWESPGAAPYLAYFTLPGNERYYEVVRPPVHLFAIDSDPSEPDGITATSVQATWLRDRLAASTQPYRVVYMHHAPFSSAENGSHPVLQWPYASWGASAVVAGHDHTYERLMRDGITYFVNGAGGHSRYAFITSVPGSVVRFNADFGAMLVDVDKKAATFSFITRAGAVVDRHAVAPR